MSDVDASLSIGLQPSLIGSFIFDDELYFAQDDASETVDGYLIAHDVLVQRMLSEIHLKHTPDELKAIDNINFYPIYNLSNHSIKLEGTYWFIKNGEEKHSTFVLPLSSEEQETLIYTMEAYCVQHHSRNCTAMLNAIRTEKGLHPFLSQTHSLPKQSSLKDRIDTVKREHPAPRCASDLPYACNELDCR